MRVFSCYEALKLVRNHFCNDADEYRVYPVNKEKMHYIYPLEYIVIINKNSLDTIIHVNTSSNNIKELSKEELNNYEYRICDEYRMVLPTRSVKDEITED